MTNAWVAALNEFKEKHGKFKIPKKGTSDYADIQKMYSSLKKGGNYKLPGSGGNYKLPGSGAVLAGDERVKTKRYRKTGLKKLESDDVLKDSEIDINKAVLGEGQKKKRGRPSKK